MKNLTLKKFSLFVLLFGLSACVPLDDCLGDVEQWTILDGSIDVIQPRLWVEGEGNPAPRDSIWLSASPVQDTLTLDMPRYAYALKLQIVERTDTSTLWIVKEFVYMSRPTKPAWPFDLIDGADVLIESGRITFRYIPKSCKEVEADDDDDDFDDDDWDWD